MDWKSYFLGIGLMGVINYIRQIHKYENPPKVDTYFGYLCMVWLFIANVFLR